MDPVLLGSRVRRVASTLEAPIDGPDCSTETVTVDHGTMARGRAPGHPEPHRGLERDGGIRCHCLGVVDPIEIDGISRRLVVVVPGELDGAAAVILFSGSARRKRCRSRWPCLSPPHTAHLILTDQDEGQRV